MMGWKSFFTTIFQFSDQYQPGWEFWGVVVGAIALILQIVQIQIELVENRERNQTQSTMPRPSISSLHPNPRGLRNGDGAGWIVVAVVCALGGLLLGYVQGRFYQNIRDGSDGLQLVATILFILKIGLLASFAWGSLFFRQGASKERIAAIVAFLLGSFASLWVWLV